MCNFWAQNGLFLMNKTFMVQTIIITFIYLLALFIVQNFKKILTANPEVWGCVIFGPQMVHLPSNFFFKKINIIFIYLLAPFILQNFKKLLKANPDLWGCAIFGPKNTPICAEQNYWYKPLLLISSTCWAFSLGKIKKKKILTADPELWGCTIFEPKMVRLHQKKNFGKIINITLIYLLAPFIA